MISNGKLPVNRSLLANQPQGDQSHASAWTCTEMQSRARYDENVFTDVTRALKPMQPEIAVNQLNLTIISSMIEANCCKTIIASSLERNSPLAAFHFTFSLPKQMRNEKIQFLFVFIMIGVERQSFSPTTPQDLPALNLRPMAKTQTTKDFSQGAPATEWKKKNAEAVRKRSMKRFYDHFFRALSPTNNFFSQPNSNCFLQSIKSILAHYTFRVESRRARLFPKAGESDYYNFILKHLRRDCVRG